MPNMALASDPTGLVVLFFGLPGFFFSVIAMLLAFSKPKVGLIFSTFVLVVQLPIFLWAAKIGYLGTAGVWLLGPVLLAAAALVISFQKEDRNRPPSEYDWVCSNCRKTNSAGVGVCKNCGMS